MKKIFIAIALFVFSSISIFSAELTTITAIGANGNKLYIATKKVGEIFGLSSALYVYQDNKITPISLSEKLSSREIVAIFIDKGALYLISQHTYGDGDNPIIYQQRKSGWSLVVTLRCSSFRKIKIAKSDVTTDCHFENGLKAKKSALKKGQFIMDHVLPAEEVVYLGDTVRFIEPLFNTEKIIFKKSGKIIGISDLK